MGDLLFEDLVGEQVGGAGFLGGVGQRRLGVTAAERFQVPLDRLGR